MTDIERETKMVEEVAFLAKIATNKRLAEEAKKAAALAAQEALEAIETRRAQREKEDAAALETFNAFMNRFGLAEAKEVSNDIRRISEAILGIDPGKGPVLNGQIEREILVRCAQLRHPEKKDRS